MVRCADKAAITRICKKETPRSLKYTEYKRYVC